MEPENLSFTNIGKLSVLLAVAVMAGNYPVWAYEVETHAEISFSAVEQAVFLTEGLARMGLRPLRIDDDRQMFINSESQPLSIIKLIQFGARWEDELSPFQVFRHFYDPANDRPLDLGGLG